MATNQPKEVYPLSTQDGVAVPLDIIRPLGLIRQGFGLTVGSFTLPAGYPILVMHTDKACIVGFDAPVVLVDGEFAADCLYIPDASTITVSVPDGATTISVVGADAVGTLYIQIVQQWASISLQSQTVRK